MLFVVIVVLIVIGIVLLMWLKPFLEYKKIGSYDEYKPVSKSLNDKFIEYSWYQVNGFKNINETAIGYLRKVSKSCTKNDLNWLYQCRKFLEAGMIEAGENDSDRLSLPQNAEDISTFTVLKVIKRSQNSLTQHYRGMGCNTCGEAIVMHTWISLRIQQIENGEAIKPGDLDYVIDAIKEIK